jgi:hypothetical protein
VAYKTDAAGDTIAAVLKASEQHWVALDVDCALVGYVASCEGAQALVDAKVDEAGRLKKKR